MDIVEKARDCLRKYLNKEMTPEQIVNSVEWDDDFAGIQHVSVVWECVFEDYPEVSRLIHLKMVNILANDSAREFGEFDQEQKSCLFGAGCMLAYTYLTKAKEYTNYKGLLQDYLKIWFSAFKFYPAFKNSLLKACDTFIAIKIKSKESLLKFPEMSPSQKERIENKYEKDIEEEKNIRTEIENYDKGHKCNTY